MPRTPKHKSRKSNNSEDSLVDISDDITQHDPTTTVSTGDHKSSPILEIVSSATQLAPPQAQGDLIRSLRDQSFNDKYFMGIPYGNKFRGVDYENILRNVAHLCRVCEYIVPAPSQDMPYIKAVSYVRAHALTDGNASMSKLQHDVAELSKLMEPRMDLKTTGIDLIKEFYTFQTAIDLEAEKIKKYKGSAAVDQNVERFATAASSVVPGTVPPASGALVTAAGVP